MSFLNQSEREFKQNQSNPNLLSKLNWKLLKGQSSKILTCVEECKSLPKSATPLGRHWRPGKTWNVIVFARFLYHSWEKKVKTSRSYGKHLILDSFLYQEHCCLDNCFGILVWYELRCVRGHFLFDVLHCFLTIFPLFWISMLNLNRKQRKTLHE